MRYYKKYCSYHKFYGNENVSDSLKCQGQFWTKDYKRIFCDPCHIKARKHRKFGDFGLKHPDNIYNETIVCKMNCITINDFQQMSPDKINKLGIFGEDFILLHFKGKKTWKI